MRTRAAIGERHVFPVHTNTTRNRSSMPPFSQALADKQQVAEYGGAS